MGLTSGTTTEESGYSTNGGQTWTPFPTDPPGVGSGGAYTGPWAGSIAASTPENILWAPANGNQPYYTLNGGETWNPVVLPGVSSWAGFQAEFYDNDRDITADRVLPNTFYLVVDTPRRLPNDERRRHLDASLRRIADIGAILLCLVAMKVSNPFRAKLAISFTRQESRDCPMILSINRQMAV